MTSNGLVPDRVNRPTLEDDDKNEYEAVSDHEGNEDLECEPDPASRKDFDEQANDRDLGDDLYHDVKDLRHVEQLYRAIVSKSSEPGEILRVMNYLEK